MPDIFGISSSDVLGTAEVIATIILIGLTLFYLRRQVKQMNDDLRARMKHEFNQKQLELNLFLAEHHDKVGNYFDASTVIGKSAGDHVTLYLLNTFETAFYMLKQHIISDEEWKEWYLYMEDVFKSPDAKALWIAIREKHLFDADFQKEADKSAGI